MLRLKWGCAGELYGMFLNPFPIHILYLISPRKESAKKKKCDARRLYVDI